MKTNVEYYATSGVYPDTEANRKAGLAGEPWPVPKMTDGEFITVIKNMRLLAWPMGGEQNSPIYRDGLVIN